MYLVDTNVFLEVLLARPKKDECERFLASLWRGEKKGFVTDFSIHTILIMMGKLKRWGELRIFLSTLSAYKGLGIRITSLADELRAAELGRKGKLDIDDAVQYAAAEALKAEAVVSFDKHFDGLEIPRVEPKAIPS